jgi:hypothetical protein
MSLTSPVLVRTPSTILHPGGNVWDRNPRHADVLVPSKSERQPAAFCSAVNGVAPETVTPGVVSPCVVLTTAVLPQKGVQLPINSASGPMINARAAPWCLIFSS